MSDIPTLVLAGKMDPITPLQWARVVSGDLSRRYAFEFPGVGHGASTSGGCPLSIVLSFLNSPRSEPDSDCMDEMTGPRFR